MSIFFSSHLFVVQKRNPGVELGDQKRNRGRNLIICLQALIEGCPWHDKVNRGARKGVRDVLIKEIHERRGTRSS